MNRHCCMSVHEVLQALQTSEDGLSESEVANRQKLYGSNQISPRSPVPAWKIFLHQFANFIIYLLLFAIVFSVIIGEYGDSLVILIILVMNGVIGFFQELKANRSLEALKQMTTLNARVTRNGVTQLIDAAELVPGDIIHLEPGDKAPADCRLIDAIAMEVDESVLTGESELVAKQVHRLQTVPGISEQDNMVFSSTAVVAGRGTAVITAVGMKTEIGKISRMIAEADEEATPLQKRLERFGRTLGVVIIGICILVFLLCIGRLYLEEEVVTSQAFLGFAFIAISLAVAAVPTALPAVVTVALSIGTRRLLKKNVLVRRLTSVETLGSCDVICSDKTGTLTRNQMTVQQGWTLSEAVNFNTDDVHRKTMQSPALRLLFKIGLVCNNAQPAADSAGEAIANPTEYALMISAQQAGVTSTEKRLKEIPFTSSRKCMSVVVEEAGTTSAYTKGAPGILLKLCRYVQVDDKVIPLTDKYKEQIEHTVNALSSQAMRVIAFAYKNVNDVDAPLEEALTFVGLQALIDPPRPDVTDSITKALQANIRVIMITGDHRETALAIAHQIGITGKALSGAELDELSDEELYTALAEVNIFTRVIPEHKQRIITALQHLGHVVAMTGDGVNDAPALKKADIGIAVGSGTDVAREASDFVLLDDSFTSIVEAVEEGRGIYENIQKSIMLLLSGNLMEVLIIFLAVLFHFNLPLTALMLLWINLITDGAPALAYSVDPYGVNIMKRPPTSMREGILPGNRITLLLILGSLGALLSLCLFHASGGNGSDGGTVQYARTMVFTYVVGSEMILVFLIRKTYQVRLFTNGWLWGAVIFSLFMQGVIMYTPLKDAFHLISLNMVALVQITAVAILFFLISIFYIRLKMKRW